MKHWAQIEERGIIWGMQLLLNVYLLFGHRALQLFLYPVVSYYWLINRQGRQASRDYLKRVARFLPTGTVRSDWFGTFQHFIQFAEALTDKLAAWSGALTMNSVDYHGCRDEILRHVDQRQGVFLLGSHLGNLEVCRVMAHMAKRVTVNVLVHTKHTEKFNTLLNRYGAAGQLNLIQVSEINMATAMRLADKIEAGELVVMAGDRTPIGSQGRVTQANFLGATALFPQGPFILASLLKCPVYTLFCLKQNGRQGIYFDHFSDRLELPRATRDAAVQRYAQDFSNRLQSYCLKAPMQWFNFFDFWQGGDE